MALMALKVGFFMLFINKKRSSISCVGSLSNWDLFRRPGPWISDPPAPCNVDMVERVIDSTMYLIFFVTGSGSTILCTLLRAQNIPCLDEPSLDKEMCTARSLCLAFFFFLLRF